MMNTTRLFWSKLKWMVMLILALLVVGSAMFLAAHRTVPVQTPVHTATTSQASSPPQASSPGTACMLLPQETPPEFATVEFKTDFSKHCVHYSEIFSGGPPKDGIPAIDAPRFVSVSSANTRLKPNEPVIDRQGIIRFVQVGPIDEATLQQKVAEISQA